MASTNSPAGNGRVPWYRRLFSRRARTEAAQTESAQPQAAKEPPRPSVMYYCAECGFGSKLRGAVYDHIKSFHKEVLDRHGRITEEVQTPH